MSRLVRARMPGGMVHSFVVVAMLASALFIIGMASRSAAEPAAAWSDFVEASKSGGEPMLPDYSWAGFDYGESPIPDVAGPVFDVTDYGAVPNDTGSDQEAIVAAIDAADTAGGGVVWIPAGEYLVNADLDSKPEILRFKSGNVVIRGEGCTEGGTVIKMVRPFEAAVPDKMYTTPFMFELRPDGSTSDKPLEVRVIEDARRETHTVIVDSTASLAPGQRVTLHLSSVEAIDDFLDPCKPDPTFTRLLSGGILVRERHIVESIDGNAVHFREPLHANVIAERGWGIRTYPVVEHIGIEDICFVGGWEQRFMHHRSALDDGGWSILKFQNLANSWIRRCAFVNVNYGLTIRNSSQISVLNVNLEGNQGHHGIHARGGYGVLIGLVRDKSGFHHGPSLGYQAVGTVYWRFGMLPDQRIDSHSGQPYATLLDRVDGGILYGNGGPWAGLPHHLRHFTLWNFYTGSTLFDEYDFWKPGAKTRFVRPIVVGFHGKPVEFVEESLQYIESNGVPVEPESLYEAQLAQRLGIVPAWVDNTKRERAELDGATFPSAPLAVRLTD